MSTAMLTSMLKHILLFPVGGRLTVLSSNNFFSKSLSYLLQLLSTVLQPTLILRQVVALTMLQLLYESSKSVSRTIQRWSTISSIQRISRDINLSTTYSQWLEASSRLETVLNTTKRNPTEGRMQTTTTIAELQTKADLYRSLLRRRDVSSLMFHLRKDLHRAYHQNHHAESAKVRNIFRETVVAALRSVAEGYSTAEDRTISIPERLAFFNETRHSFGRSALCLSGGATMGLYHIGVVKALYEAELLPRVISGASAGSIICGILGTRTNQEIPEVFHFENINARFFSDATSPSTTDKNSLSINEWIAMLPPPLPMLLAGVRRKVNKGYALDIHTLETALRENCGDMTFQEAFDRTGRIVNIVVTPTREGRIPMVLNYLTSPHVLVWSASLASCAVPGVFEPIELRCRNIQGEEVPYFPQGQKWSDGSVENDLPMQRLSELFNVNFFIVSQVNPHALFFAGTTLGSSRFARLIQFLKLQVKGWIRNISVLSLQFGIPLLGKGLLPLLTQKYEGDITLVPRWGLNDLFELFKDPDKPRFDACTVEGERITWPLLSKVRDECEIERVMDRCTRQLRLKLAHQEDALNSPKSSPSSKNKQQLNSMRTRIPSFTTSASLLGINVLDAGAPGPGNVRRRPSFHRRSKEM
jgi:TAG lipase / steryl ester hydrolase / phospholipase A2 / LPA acyltransferase